MHRNRWIKLIGASLFVLVSATAAAETPARSVEESRAESFQSVKGPVAEEVPGGLLLVIAYATLWMALMLYLLRIERMSRRISLQMDQLEASAKAHEGSQAAPIALAD
ncbi:MAG: hypothetical protein H6715_01795 [Myxococcales bacterium]|nr:hypothetical protein [Myxococcales bacterium]MCB9707579.1 hypothetical protein [Myxococcales bacterium]